MLSLGWLLKVQKYEKYHLHNIDYSLIATVLCQ